MSELHYSAPGRILTVGGQPAPPPATRQAATRRPPAAVAIRAAQLRARYGIKPPPVVDLTPIPMIIDLSPLPDYLTARPDRRG